jgi:hypothetical protein
MGRLDDGVEMVWIEEKACARSSSLTWWQEEIRLALERSSTELRGVTRPPSSTTSAWG